MKSLFIFIIPIIIAYSCTKDKKLNVFSLAQDKQLGGQLDHEIRTNKAEYPLLDSATNPDVYKYLYLMRDDILSSNLIFHRDDFNWRVTVINKNVLNAFAAPGGKIYVYTGLLKFVKSGAELAGILAHEITHADRRHSTDQMTKVYGFQMVLNVILGSDTTGLVKTMARNMASGAASLAWSRDNESEADSMAVEFLWSIKNRKAYQINALSNFFKRMDSLGLGTTSTTIAWLQDHPLDATRISSVDGHWKRLGSPVGNLFSNEYFTVIARLPKY
jgi:predicted Zn-dependent protease